MLHVITKSPFQSAGTTVTLDGGERSLVRGSLRHAGIIAEDKLAYKISGEYFTAQDFEYIDPNEPTDVLEHRSAHSAVASRHSPSRTTSTCKRYAGEARLDYKLDENTHADLERRLLADRQRRARSRRRSARRRSKDWSYLNLQERLHHKNFFAQVFYNKSNSGNCRQPRRGRHVLSRGRAFRWSTARASSLPRYSRDSDWMRTKFVAGAEYLATRPQTEGTIDGRNENNDNINEYGGYLQTTTPIVPKLDFLAAARVDANSRIDGYAVLAPRGADLQARFEQQFPRHIQPRV